MILSNFSKIIITLFYCWTCFLVVVVSETVYDAIGDKVSWYAFVSIVFLYPCIFQELIIISLLFPTSVCSGYA